MPIFHELPAAPGGVPVKAWTANLEESAATQLRALAGSGLLVGHVAAMPDVHAGYGATVGSVFATRDLLLPSAIGTDIGCGVLAQPLDVRASDLPPALLRELQAQIKWTIPLAHGEQGEAQAWDGLADDRRYTEAVARIVHEAGPWQLGTLGGGNHFLELCREAEGEGAAARVWLLVHSGSRGVGSAIAAHHIGIARTLAPRLGRPSVGDLAPLPLDTQEGQDYLTDLLWAQAYAAENRRQLQQAVLNLLARLVGRYLRHELVYDLTAGFDSVHNYAAREEHFGELLWVHRKGAAAAPIAAPGIIPGSMATGSYLVRGLGNAAALGSCSHGAGRRMSRGRRRARSRWKRSPTRCAASSPTPGASCSTKRRKPTRGSTRCSPSRPISSRRSGDSCRCSTSRASRAGHAARTPLGVRHRRRIARATRTTRSSAASWSSARSGADRG